MTSFRADTRVYCDTLMPWWGWVLIFTGVAAVLALTAVLFRRQLRFAMKVTKALATDERVPRPMRWAIGIALAMKVVPFPDFGVDEVILLVIGVLLLTIYRPTFVAIVAESRAANETRSEPSSHREVDLDGPTEASRGHPPGRPPHASA